MIAVPKHSQYAFSKRDLTAVPVSVDYWTAQELSARCERCPPPRITGDVTGPGQNHGDFKVAVLKNDVVVPERVPLMILFAETRGFTRMSEILEPSVVLACISECFALVSAAIERHEGAVSNVFNDTLVATFAGPDNAQHAVRAAQDIQHDFAPLAEAWERDHDIRAAVALGLHGGDTVVGPAGGPMREQRLIIGDSVSVAERLLHRARAGVRAVESHHGRACGRPIRA